ncbi:MAG: Apolipoprotein N-acyltransferase [Limisphaerales bacterium]|nr:MAG: Apolipoprotein N-acyltransferase [Limisphaerales bacterium]KAG0506720.1 MAG: Apolipoprotein N-acyltransferase [Limisphaerales bacterium]TXT45190.1 MAG: Apolipoprotein N-acyltransferase [Limisphaerales bacterium]
MAHGSPRPRHALRGCLRAPCPAKLRRLNEFFQRHETALRHALAVVAGLLLAAAFPKPGVAGFAWVAPGLLLFSAAGQPAKVAFRLGWLGGLAFNLAALHWLLFIPVKGFPILGWLALSAYAAVYPALWVWLCWRLAPVPATSSRRHEPLVAASFGQRAAWALKCAVLWVALETIVGCLLTGFPWLALGVSQHKMVPLIQIASVTGVGGVSVLAVWFAVALVEDTVGLARQRSGLCKRRLACLLPLFITAAVAVGGLANFFPHRSVSSRQNRPPEIHELRLALVQPSIPQTMIWNPAEKTNRFAKLMQLSELALATKPDVLVWPEAALPDMSEENFRAVTNLVATHKVFMVFGADDYELKPGAARDSNQPTDYAFYNSAFLLSPEGKVVSTYRKRRLVIFGEYIPLADWLPFLKWFTPIQSGFTAGKEPVAFQLGSLEARRPDISGERRMPQPALLLRAGMLICFEDAIAAAARESAADADFLLNLTNDGWFGESAQQFQHAAHSVFRAVENRRPVVRCTNNGLTCWVDETGFVHDLGVGDAADVHGTGFRVVKLSVPAGPRAPTFYQRHGDWFGWGCVFATLGLLARSHLRRRG